MKSVPELSFMLASILALGGCAFVPKAYPRLDEARLLQAQARADSQVVVDAASELRNASEVLERASTARDTLDDPAVVDHLAYLTKQRIAIAREVASQRASQRAIDAAWTNVKQMATYRQENP
jgi:Domain of unknown function (DUF4398)